MMNQEEKTAAFRSGMRRLASGVSIIATAEKGRRHGMLATSVTSVTVEPPILLICVNKAASLFEPLSRTGKFSVNVLSEDQADLVAAFSNSDLRDLRFRDGYWVDSENGTPVLHGAEVSFVCEVRDSREIGSHEIIFGEVVDVSSLRPQPQPMIWHEGKCRSLNEQDLSGHSGR